MMCVDCPPHNVHYGRCFNFNGPNGGIGPACECPTEEPPLPVSVPTAAERGYANDDRHELWLETGEGGSTWLRDIEDRREAATLAREG